MKDNENKREDLEEKTEEVRPEEIGAAPSGKNEKFKKFRNGFNKFFTVFKYLVVAVILLYVLTYLVMCAFVGKDDKASAAVAPVAYQAAEAVSVSSENSDTVLYEIGNIGFFDTFNGSTSTAPTSYTNITNKYILQNPASNPDNLFYRTADAQSFAYPLGNSSFLGVWTYMGSIYITDLIHSGVGQDYNVISYKLEYYGISYDSYNGPAAAYANIYKAEGTVNYLMDSITDIPSGLTYEFLYKQSLGFYCSTSSTNGLPLSNMNSKISHFYLPCSQEVEYRVFNLAPVENNALLTPFAPSLTVALGYKDTAVNSAYQKIKNEILNEVEILPSYNDGYTQGFADGSKQTADAAYTTGYNNGYSKGQEVGNEEGYALGEAAGYDKGYDAGLQEAADSSYSAGYTAGETDGYNDGYSQGQYDGYNQGYKSGLTTGKILGSSEGEQIGYDKGYAAGVAATEDRYETGKSDGIAIGRQEREDEILSNVSDPVYKQIVSQEYTAIFEEGYSDGYSVGIEENQEAAFQAGVNSVKEMNNVIGAVGDVSVGIFSNFIYPVMQFEVAGISLLSIFCGIAILALIFWAVKMLMGI